MGGGLRLRGGLERVAGCPPLVDPLLEQQAARRLQRACWGWGWWLGVGVVAIGVGVVAIGVRVALLGRRRR